MILLLLSLLACGSPTPSAPDGGAAPAPTAPAGHADAEGSDLPLPNASLYPLGTKLVDQHGATVPIDVHRGHPVVISMFYANCPSACPMLIEDLKSLEATLSPADLADLRVLLVSLDPERDTPELLTKVIAEHELDTARWTLGSPAKDDVRVVAAALGIRYRPTGDGEMNHSSVLTLLDVEGRPVARLEGLRRDPAPLRDALAQARAPRPQP